jgi:uncharacterized protein with PIN domain
MKFIVDAMFGRLARWLRMSGYDTVYDVDLRNGRIVMIALEEGRAVITRDRDVYRRSVTGGVQATFVSSLDFPEQLKQVIDEYGVVFRDSPEYSRCPVCNSNLKQIDKKDIKAELPERVRDLYEEFWECLGCGKVYWHGGHWKNIKDTVDLLRGAEDD